MARLVYTHGMAFRKAASYEGRLQSLHLLKLYSLIILASDMKVLMVKRPPTGIFPDLHVFPGGHVEKADAIEAGKQHDRRPNEIETGKACALRETVEETGFFPFREEKQSLSQIAYWMTWRTPDFREIYPIGWDMHIFACETDNISRFDATYDTSEVLEAKWISIDHIMRAAAEKALFLAPPQWYMLGEMRKYGRPAEFLRSIAQPEDLCAVFQPRLVQDAKEPEFWHSILPGDREYPLAAVPSSDMSALRAPLNRMIMRKIGPQKFCDFRLIRR